MTVTFQEFINSVKGVQADINRDYGEGDAIPNPCHILHRDMQLEATTPDDVHEQIEAIARVRGIDPATINPGTLDFTVEHGQLHQFLHAMRIQASMAGLDGDAQIALALAIGRRMGMREAAQMFGSWSVSDNVDEVGS